MKPKLSALIHRLGKVMSSKQAVQEARYIQRELDPSKWIHAANRRAQLEPLQYILGTQPFGSKLDLMCRPGVLIPRLDTESWVMDLADSLKSTENLNIVDYCTGSGCIGLSLLSELPQTKSLIGLDISEEAINLAQDNFQRNITHFNSESKVAFQISNLLECQFDVNFPNNKESINLLVSNPPYIPRDHMNEQNGVEQSVLKYEPDLALIGDLEFYESLCQIMEYNSLINGFVFELGYVHQAEYVGKLMSSLGWEVGVKHDDMERLRCVVGWKTPNLHCLNKFIDESLL